MSSHVTLRVIACHPAARASSSSKGKQFYDPFSSRCAASYQRDARHKITAVLDRVHFELHHAALCLPFQSVQRCHITSAMPKGIKSKLKATISGL
jgi:hypothetical protein